MITEYTSATFLPPDCSAQVDGYGNLVLSVAQETSMNRYSGPSRTRYLSKRRSFHRRGDGRGPAPHRALAQHQGAPRLLLRDLRWPGHESSPWATTCLFISAPCRCRCRPPSLRSPSNPATSPSSMIPTPVEPISPTSPWSFRCFLPGRRSAGLLRLESRSPCRRGRAFPGSMGPANEIFQEGIRIPPVRIVRGGNVDREILDLILLNVRTPARTRGRSAIADRSLPRGRAAHSATRREVWRQKLHALPRNCSTTPSASCAPSCARCPPATSLLKTGSMTTA